MKPPDRWSFASLATDMSLPDPGTRCQAELPYGAAIRSCQTELPDLGARMDVEVTHEPERDRFTVTVDGVEAGFAQYRERPGVVSFVHTEIDPGQQGQGLASRLIAYALEDARERELAVLPHCSFVREYIVEHPRVHGARPRAPSRGLRALAGPPKRCTPKRRPGQGAVEPGAPHALSP